MIGGDFIVDFNRPSGPLGLLTAAMTDLNLVAVDFISQPTIGFTYERDDGSAHSWPDHFLCDSSFLPAFTSVYKVDSGSNLSDHHPIAAMFLLHLYSLKLFCSTTAQNCLASCH